MADRKQYGTQIGAGDYSKALENSYQQTVAEQQRTNEAKSARLRQRLKNAESERLKSR